MPGDVRSARSTGATRGANGHRRSGLGGEVANLAELLKTLVGRLSVTWPFQGHQTTCMRYDRAADNIAS